MGLGQDTVRHCNQWKPAVGEELIQTELLQQMLMAEQVASGDVTALMRLMSPENAVLIAPSCIVNVQLILKYLFFGFISRYLPLAFEKMLIFCSRYSAVKRVYNIFYSDTGNLIYFIIDNDANHIIASSV